MTNLEMVLNTDGERFIKEIAEKICFCEYKHTVKTVQPPLCGDCAFGEVRYDGKAKCHTDVRIVSIIRENREEVSVVIVWCTAIILMLI